MSLRLSRDGLIYRSSSTSRSSKSSTMCLDVDDKIGSPRRRIPSTAIPLGNPPKTSTSTKKELKLGLHRYFRQQRLTVSFFVLCGIVFVGVWESAHLVEHHHHSQPHYFQAQFHSVPKVYSPRTSEFSIKPRMVAYVDLTVSQTLQSYYKDAIRIDVNSRRVVSPTRAMNRTNPKWTWSHQKVDPLSDVPQEGGIITATNDHDANDQDDCQLPHEWMKQQFPTCNNLHEQDMLDQLNNPKRRQSKFLLGKGSMRSVWLLEHHHNQQRHPQQYSTEHDDSTDITVLKTLNLIRDFTEDNWNRHRRDAIISERLTSSPHFLNVYGHCAQSAVYEYADGGSLYDAIGAKEYEDESRDEIAHAQWKQWTNRRKLDLVYQVVSAVADLHDIDRDGIPSVAHDDLDVTQFVSTDGGKTYRLSDFNGAPFIKFNRKLDRVCPFHALMKGGKTRSPQEYKGEEVTEKLDVFAMGNIIYTIVTGQYPFYNLYDKATKENVINGVLPEIPAYINEQKDVIMHGLLNSMRLCWKYDEKQRVSAAKLKRYLETILEQVDNNKDDGQNTAEEDTNKDSRSAL